MAFISTNAENYIIHAAAHSWGWHCWFFFWNLSNSRFVVNIDLLQKQHFQGLHESLCWVNNTRLVCRYPSSR